jgi:dTDP-4-dehydrorhamnose reductase
MNDSVLVVGEDSTIGSALAARLRSSGIRVAGTSRRPGTRLFLDLAKPETFGPALAARCRHAVVCAAVASAEAIAKTADAREVNVSGTIALLDRLTRCGAFCWFLSSNTVFDGADPAPRVSDPASPRTTYGTWKSEVERFILDHHASSAAIVRLTKVLGPEWPLGHRALAAARAARPFEAFHDWVFSPITLASVVDALAHLIRTQPPRSPALFHLSSSDSIDYAVAIERLFALAGAPGSLVQRVSIRDRLEVEWNPHHAALDAVWEKTHLAWNLRPSLETIDSWFDTRDRR